MNFCVLLSLLLAVRVRTAENIWTYDPKDPTGHQNWKNYHPICGKDAQSPVHITREAVVVNDTLGPFSFTKQYSQPVPGPITVENNGHTVVWKFSNVPTKLEVSEGGLPFSYRLIQFHFHWGGNNSVGSEHIISNKQFPMELHLVHQVTGTDQAPADMQLAVLGIMFEPSETDNPWINEIFDAEYGRLLFKGQNISLPKLPPMAYALPQKKNVFFRYQGSLTTPPCSEAVIWSVFPEPVPISHRQLHDFRILFATTQGNRQPKSMNNNFRPVQPLNERQIQVSRVPAIMNSAVGFASLSALILSCLSLVALF